MTESVGYKKPPRHTRWAKGQSGNPSGRAKGQRNLKSDLLAELSEVVQISEAGKPRRISKQRALLKGLTARAIGGDTRAATLVLNLVMSLLGPDPQAPAHSALAAEDEALLRDFVARQGRPKGDPT